MGSRYNSSRFYVIVSGFVFIVVDHPQETYRKSASHAKNRVPLILDKSRKNKEASLISFEEWVVCLFVYLKGNHGNFGMVGNILAYAAHKKVGKPLAPVCGDANNVRPFDLAIV